MILYVTCLMLLVNNMQLREDSCFCVCCLKAFKGFAFILRVILGFMWPIGGFINITRLCIFTISIIWQNWWKDYDNENFMTNCSWITATFCWMLWCFTLAIMCFVTYAYIRELVKAIKTNGPGKTCINIGKYLKNCFKIQG